MSSSCETWNGTCAYTPGKEVFLESELVGLSVMAERSTRPSPQTTKGERREHSTQEIRRPISRTWLWDTDGLEVSGTYLRMDEATTDYGRQAICVSPARSAASGGTRLALVSRFRDELATRPTGDFTVGERIEIKRGAEKVTSASGRDYWPFDAQFPGAPKRTASDILGVAPAEPELPPEPSPAFVQTANDDDIPV
jgi:hypothetical protein